MKTKFLLFLFSFVFSVAYAQNDDEDYDVYLMIGQSNMAGRAQMISQDSLPIEGVWLLDSLGGVAPAVSPLNQYSTIRKGINMQGISIANGFAREITKHTDRKVLLIVNARGGTQIEMWQKGNVETPYYDEAIRRCKDAAKYGKIKAILWHQGESNSADVENYMTNLVKFVTDLRKDLGDETIPFIAGEIGRWNEFAEDFNAVIITISDNIPFSAYISSENAGMRSDINDPHFSRDGELLLGERYVQKLYDLK